MLRRGLLAMRQPVASGAIPSHPVVPPGRCIHEAQAGQGPRRGLGGGGIFIFQYLQHGNNLGVQ